MPDVDDLTPWSQQSAESAKAYHAFTGHFLTLPNWQRSMAEAYTDHLRRCKGQNPVRKAHAPEVWTQWRFRHAWLDRAAAYDAAMVERTRSQHLHEVEAMNARHISLAVAVQNLCVARLQEIAASGAVLTMTPLQLARVIDVAAACERRARGLPTAIVKTQSDDGPMLDLSRLDPDELAIFEKLASKAAPRTQEN